MKKIGILGTGNIGTDLLIKLNKLGYENIAFVGRRETSDGIKLASSLGFKTSIEGIDYFKKNSDFDVVLDCTNAFDAVEHYNVLRNLGIKVIDLTPAKIGQICVPTINGSDINKYDNINMITCGGQASLPMIHAICESVKDILNINPAEPCVDMQTTIFMKINNLETINFENIVENVYSRLKEIKRYVPNYELVMPPMVNENNILMLSVKVRGLGDYLPEYAGNLDIINCAAIKILEFL